ncbi:MAG TPA: MBL fold metallo-hydrolase [Syntrophorhabdaceae bacterium]|nr:MBL fold metallo-hydrolase [Syntrophorhabdaceae bacterium]
MKRFLIFSFFVFFTFLFFATTTYADEVKVKNMLKNIHWLGHDTFKITGEKNIYIDPFKITKKDTADIILVTHGHHDHCSDADINMLTGPNTIIISPKSCAEKLKGPVKTIKRGDVFDIGNIKIEAVPAYNVDKQYHPKSADGVGYIITVYGVRIYHAGDTDRIPEMKTFKEIDIALLPVSGKYVMTADEAVQAAEDIKPKIAIPMHYGTIIGTEEDAMKFKDTLKGKIEVVILKKE